MPMEHEIAALKAKLILAEDRVKELEASKVRSQEVVSFLDSFEFFFQA